MTVTGRRFWPEVTANSSRVKYKYFPENMNIYPYYIFIYLSINNMKMKQKEIVLCVTLKYIREGGLLIQGRNFRKFDANAEYF